MNSMFDRRTLILGGTAVSLAVGSGLLPLTGRADTSPGLAPKHLAEIEARAAGLDQLHSLVIARGGQIQFAKAFRGPGLEQAVNVKSVSKTIVATLTGIAIARGEISHVGVPILEFLEAPAGADPRIASITVEDLLTMRAGLERTSGRNYGNWVQSQDWVADALKRPMVAEPGGQFLYSTGSYHLLGAILAKAAGQSLLDLAKTRLAEPLGFDLPAWTRDPQGRYMGGNNMVLSPMDLLEFARLWLNQGRAGDAQVIDPAWVEASWTKRTRSPFSRHDYGYGWFLTKASGYQLAYARGYGGQMVYVLPELDLAVIVTSDPTRPARSAGYAGDLYSLLSNTIVPAIVQA